MDGFGCPTIVPGEGGENHGRATPKEPGSHNCIISHAEDLESRGRDTPPLACPVGQSHEGHDHQNATRGHPFHRTRTEQARPLGPGYFGGVSQVKGKIPGVLEARPRFLL